MVELKSTLGAIMFAMGLTAATGLVSGKAEAQAPKDTKPAASQVASASSGSGANLGGLVMGGQPQTIPKSEPKEPEDWNTVKDEADGICGAGNDSCDQYTHIDGVRRGLVRASSNLIYPVSSLVRTLNGNFAPLQSYDFWGMTGISKGRSKDKRKIVAKIGPIPGVLDKAVEREYERDLRRGTHYQAYEFGSVANALEQVAGPLFTNQMAKRLVMANQHKGEGKLDPNKIIVLRYDPMEKGNVVHLTTAEAGIVRDIMYVCPDKGVCRGTDGKPIGHIAKNSQEIDLAGPYKLVHPMIEGCNNPILVYDPETDKVELFTSGVFAIPMDLYGKPLGYEKDAERKSAPAPAPVQPAPVPQETAPAPAPVQTPPAPQETTPAPVAPVAPVVTPKPKETEPEDISDKTTPDYMEDPIFDLIQKKPSYLITGRGLYLANNFMPGNAWVASLGFGGKIANGVYLVGLLGGGYGGSERVRDPDSRETLPNTNDPFSLGSSVEAYDSTKAYIIAPELEFRFDVTKGLYLATGGGVHVTLLDRKRDVSEELTYPNGDLVDSENYSDSRLDTVVLGVLSGGLGLKPSERFSIDLRALGGTDFDGNAVYGGGGGLTVYW